MNEIEKHAAEGVNKLLVGNKCDLASRKVVSTGETKELEDFSEHQALGGKRQERAQSGGGFQHDGKWEPAGRQGNRADCSD